ncbi:hypothetical protein AKO1_015827 [Acrasis kona]|uniref:EF-hand domain-containing protein n=1 Tax=Acrasis kona TaxID=1008807 RepID=A0AAW2ZH53_9EUKA
MAIRRRTQEGKEPKRIKKDSNYEIRFRKEFGKCIFHEYTEEDEEDPFNWKEDSPETITGFDVCTCGVVQRHVEKLNTTTHNHDNWELVYNEKKLSEQMAEYMEDIQLESESEDEYRSLYYSHTDGGRIIDNKIFYLVDPNKDGLITMQEMKDVFQGGIHPKVVEEGGDVQDINRWLSYARVDDDDNSTDDENSDEDDEKKSKITKVIKSMEHADLKRITWIVYFADGMMASPYSVHIMGVSPRTGNLVGIQSTVVWT